MNELIKLEEQIINDTVIQTVNARDLHSFLEVGKDFSSWIKGRINKYEFIENENFIIVENLSSPDLGNAKSRSQKLIDYYISIDMAKELSMVENNEKGKQARKYFIECEKQLKQALTDKDTLLLGIFKAEGDINKALAINAYEIGYVRPLEIKVEEQAQHIEILEPKADFYDTIVQSQSTLDLGQVAKILNYNKLGRNNLFKYLRDNDIFNHKNIPYQQYVTSGYFKLCETSWVHPTTQELEVTVKPVMYQKGVDWLDKMLAQDGYIKSTKPIGKIL